MTVGATVLEYALSVARAGSAAAVALSLGTTEAAANRVGLFADLTASAEFLQVVAGGVSGPIFQRAGANVMMTSLKVQDSTFQILDNLDNTKSIAFQAATQGSGFQFTFDIGAQTGNRTASVPVLAGADTFALLGVANAFTGANTFSNAAAILLTSATGTTLAVSSTQAAASAITGAVTIGNGVAATSIGLGGGNVNAGGTLIVGGTSTFNGMMTDKTATDTVPGTIASFDSRHFLIKPGTTNGLAFSITDATGAAYITSLNPGVAWNSLNFQCANFNVNPNGSTTMFQVASTGIITCSSTTSATSSITGAVTIGNGVAATSVAIGGGNINAGGTLTVGGRILDADGTTAAPAYAFALHADAGISYASGVVISEAGVRLVTLANGAVTFASAAPTSFLSTTSATSSTVGAVTIGNGVAATSIGLGGGNGNFGGTLTVGTSATARNYLATGGTIVAAQPILDGTVTWNNAAVTFTAVRHNITDTASAGGSILLDLQVSGTSRVKATKEGQLAVTQSAQTTAANSALVVTGGAHTSLNGVENIDVLYSLARSVQWNAMPGTQRAFVISAPTYTGVGAVTLANGATVAITGPPIAGANMTITNAWALWVQSGITRLDGALEVSSATLIKSNTTLTNGAAAAAGTLGNAPAAGNPTKWIPLNDNGTTRYIPAW